MSRVQGTDFEVSPELEPLFGHTPADDGLRLVDDTYTPPDSQLGLDFESTSAARQLTDEEQARIIGLARAVSAVARGLHGTSFTRADLEGEGMAGVVRSVFHFDPSRGASPETYAIACARGSMTDALRDRDRVVRGHRKNSANLVKVKSSVANHDNGVTRVPDSLVAEETGLTEADVRHYRDAPRIPHIESIFKPILVLSHGGTMELIDILVGEEDHAPAVNVAVDVNAAIDGLSLVRAEIIRYVFGISPFETAHTYPEAAEHFGISKDSIYRHVKAAKKTLESTLSGV